VSESCPGPLACDLARRTLALSELELREQLSAALEEVATAAVWIYRVVEQRDRLEHENALLRERLELLVDADRAHRRARARKAAA
jgi:hypothetical protein